MRNILFFSGLFAVMILCFAVSVNAEWYDANYKYKMAINASCELCNSSTSGFIPINYSSLLNFGSGKQEIWCKYNLSNVSKTVGWLYYNNDSSYACVSNDEKAKTIMNIASGNESNYGSPETDLLLWLHMEKINESDNSRYNHSTIWSNTSKKVNGKFGNAFYTNISFLDSVPPSTNYIVMIPHNSHFEYDNVSISMFAKSDENTGDSQVFLKKTDRTTGGIRATGFYGYDIEIWYNPAIVYFAKPTFNNAGFLCAFACDPEGGNSNGINLTSSYFSFSSILSYNNPYTTNEHFVFLNGFNKFSSSSNSIVCNASQPDSSPPPLNNYNIEIGSQYGTGSYGLASSIDEIMLYNRTLSDNEIAFFNNQTSFLAENYSAPPNEFSIKIISPKNQSYNGTRLVNLSIIKSGTINTTWYYNGTHNITFSGLEEYFLGNYGSNQIIVYANDSTGAINKSEKIVYTLDIPNISLITPKNQTYFNRALNVTISITGTINTTWYYNGTNNVTFSGLETYPYYMNDNNSQITIYGNDSYGRIFSSEKIAFIIDLNAPEILISSDSTNSSLTPFPKYFLANASFSDFYGLSNMTLFINDSNGNISSYSVTTGTNITRNFTGLILPYYSYWFETKDNNNRTTKTVPRYIGSVWGISTHTKRKLITLNESMIYGRNFDFPVFLKITDTQILKYSKNEIIFTSANGNDRLKFYFEKYNSSEAYVWVKYNIMNSTKNYMWIYYNGASGSYEDEAGTFSDYIARFSMSEIPLKDSTGNFLNCTPVNSPVAVSGLTGNGIYFNYSKEQHFQCSITQKIKEIQKYSFEYIFNPNTNFKHALSSFCPLNESFPNAYDDPYFKTGMDSGGQLLDYNVFDDNTAVGFFGGYLAGSNIFYYASYNYDSSFIKMSLQNSINGFSTSLKNYKNYKRLNDSDLFFIAIQKYGFSNGTDWISGNTRAYNGIIDEIRISNFSRTDEYIKTSYYNTIKNSQFYSLGNESPPTISIISPCNKCEYATFGLFIYNISDEKSECFIYIDGSRENLNCSTNTFLKIVGFGKHTVKISANSTFGIFSNSSLDFYVYQEIQGNMTNTALFNAEMPIREKLCLGTRLITIREKTYCSGGICQTFNSTEAEICHFGCIENFTTSNAFCNLAPEEKYPLVLIISIIILTFFFKITKPKKRSMRL